MSEVANDDFRAARKVDEKVLQLDVSVHHTAMVNGSDHIKAGDQNGLVERVSVWYSCELDSWPPTLYSKNEIF